SAAGVVERRVGQQPPAADLDQRGRPADVRDADVHAASPAGAGGVMRACASAHSSASSATSTQLSAAGRRCGPGYSLISVIGLAAWECFALERCPAGGMMWSSLPLMKSSGARSSLR